jgi:hypothetical protein
MVMMYAYIQYIHSFHTRTDLQEQLAKIAIAGINNEKAARVGQAGLRRRSGSVVLTTEGHLTKAATINAPPPSLYRELDPGTLSLMRYHAILAIGPCGYSLTISFLISSMNNIASAKGIGMSQNSIGTDAVPNRF